MNYILKYQTENPNKYFIIRIGVINAMYNELPKNLHTNTKLIEFLMIQEIQINFFVKYMIML